MVNSVLGGLELAADATPADIEEAGVMPIWIPPENPLGKLKEGARANLGTLNHEFLLLSVPSYKLKSISCWFTYTQWVRKLQKSRPKKIVKSYKSKSWIFLWPNSIFCHFKIGQKSIFELRKSLKLPKIQFHEKKFDLFDVTSFFVWTFLNFLSSCVLFE